MAEEDLKVEKKEKKVRDQKEKKVKVAKVKVKKEKEKEDIISSSLMLMENAWEEKKQLKKDSLKE